jgi:hypothetical protein
MDTRTDALARESRVRDVDEAGGLGRRQGFLLISYGIVAGPITTAIGALVAQPLSGLVRIVAWSTVTTVLAIGAIFIAQPGLIILDRYLHSTRAR